MNEIFVFTDGGARGNPGPSAIGVFITDKKGKKIVSIGKRIGEGTNNIAEYKAVIEALNFLLKNKNSFVKDTKVSLFLDSQLIYSQILGIYKIKNSTLRNLLFKIRELETQLQAPVSYNFIPREKNKNADKLVNLALDNLL